MKPLSIAFAVALAICAFSKPALAKGKPNDPCRKKQSNVDMRECYTKEHAKVDAQLDSYVKQVAAGLRRAAVEDAASTVEDGLIQNAASGVEGSQKSWKVYRGQYCKAVGDSWTTGSGAGVAYERCMFQLGLSRLQQLRSDLSLWVTAKH